MADGVWSWSDGSLWNFTSWSAAVEITEGTSQCLMTSSDGTWTSESCTGDFYDIFSYGANYPFVCKVVPHTLATTTKKRYTRDQLNIPSLQVHYSYQAASQELLSAWQEKRMTGFRLSWRVEGADGPDLELTTDVVGSVIETPGFQTNNFDASRFKRNHTFSATLAFPPDLSRQVGDGTLVIELEVDTRQESSQEEYVEYRGANKEFIVYDHVPSKWKAAAESCENDGHQLASILNEMEQEKLISVFGSRRKCGWLGGKYQENEKKWHWADGSTWTFINWGTANKHDDIMILGKCLCLAPWAGLRWIPKACGDYHSVCSPICQTSPIRINGTTKLTLNFTQAQVNFPSFQVWYRFHKLDQNFKNNLSGKKNTGFRLKWFIQETDKPRLKKQPKLINGNPEQNPDFLNTSHFCLRAQNGHLEEDSKS